MPSDSTAGAGEEAFRDGSRLCLECGICCHGVLHYKADVREDEVEAATALGLPIERDRDKLMFALPCVKVDGTRCTIYADRPTACAAYRCGLLKRYQRGEIELDRALPLIAEAKRLFASATAVIPVGRSFRELRWQWRQQRRGTTDGAIAPEERAALAQPLLRITMLDLFLDKHFRLKRERTFVKDDDETLPMAGS